MSHRWLKWGWVFVGPRASLRRSRATAACCAEQILGKALAAYRAAEAAKKARELVRRPGPAPHACKPRSSVAATLCHEYIGQHQP